MPLFMRHESPPVKLPYQDPTTLSIGSWSGLVMWTIAHLSGV
jgi:hypothetical protein